MGKEIYAVDLPEGFDYHGQLKEFSGTVTASSPRQAVRFFFLRQVGKNGMGVYDDFKQSVQDTSRFAAPAINVITDHYADLYSNDPDYSGRVSGILADEGVQYKPNAQQLRQILGNRYGREYGGDEQQLRTVCVSVMKQRKRRKMGLIGESGPVIGGQSEHVL
jgi:hypothetical protein